ncbi:hypothetical protein PDL71_08550 [Lacibacter sp. MH-610]|uniref:hypothetical protein n=1 Tax=Lacibacter sp. MH-610 TaxID=3020883 RepID=UPI00389187E7
MNKLFIVTILTLLEMATVNAQILNPTRITTLKPIKTSQVPVYTLTNARVSITTGRDNKEFPSEVTVWLIQKGKGILFQQPGSNTRNEMQVNSTNEFGLYKWTNTVNIGSFLLTDIQQSGIILRILYLPHLFTDAWRIEGISVTLEFKDQNGNLHPTLGKKTIVFNNTSGFLNDWEKFFECRADGSFTPIISTILKDATGFN